MNSTTEEMATIDIDLDAFSKEDLISIIVNAHERNMTFNEYIVYALTTFVENHKDLLEEKENDIK